MKRKLITTFIYSDQAMALAPISLPRHITYAHRVGADYLIRGRQHPEMASFWERLIVLWEMLHVYDRVLVLDLDMLVRADCPDLFEMVPYAQVGMADEGQTGDPTVPGNAHEKRADSLRHYYEDHDLHWRGWDGHYYNIGSILVSRPHLDLIRVPEDGWNGSKYGYWNEQCLVNGRIHSEGWPVCDLTWRFNRMGCMATLPDCDPDPLEAFIIHYAGARSIETVAPQMAADDAAWEARGL